jgi:hypothetical protein
LATVSRLPVENCDFFNVEACHFDNVVLKYTMRELGWMTVGPATVDRPANFAHTTAAIGFDGAFSVRNPLNVPGPFYGANTDNCETGPQEAPDNVLLDSDGREFIFLQPRNPEEVKAVLLAARAEAFSGYGADGNDHWDLPLLREWWRDRQAVLEWVVRELKAWDPGTVVDEAWLRQRNMTRVAALHAFRQFLEERLEAYLRVYAFFLSEKHPPQSGNALPEVC